MNRPESAGRSLCAFDRLPTGSRFWAAVVTLAALAGFAVARWPIPSLALIAVLGLMMAVMTNREFALGAVLVTSMVTLGAISWLGLPDQASLLTKVLIGLFALGIILDWTPDKQLEIPVVFIMLAAVLVISAVFGSGGRFLAAQALGAYLAAPIAYLAIVNSGLRIKTLRRLALLVLFMVVAQVPIMIVQSRFVGSVDDIGGTYGLGGSTQMLSLVFAIAWTVAVALLTGRRATWLIPIGMTITFALLISEGKAGFIFAAGGTIAVGLAKAIANPRRGVFQFLLYVALGVGAVAVLLGAYIYLAPILPGGIAQQQYWVQFLKSPSAVMDYLFAPDSGGQAGRLGGTQLALAQARTLADLLIGHGPGLLSGSALLGRSSVASSTIGFALSWATSLTRFLLEVGLIGILLYLSAMGAAVAAVAKAWASGRDSLGISVTAAGFGATMVYVAGALYHSPWTTDAIAVPFWCLLGIAVAWGRQRTAEKDHPPPATDLANER